jgi:TolB-like protein
MKTGIEVLLIYDMSFVFCTGVLYIALTYPNDQMSNSPGKLSQFWQELKRRNVTRVLAVYIAAGFMILELVDMTSEPFGLPDWSMKAAFFILLAGLIIAVIVSWIYDVTPGGIKKTMPSGQVEKGEDQIAPPSWKNWKIATYVSAVVIIGLILFNIFTLNRVSDSLALYGKSIAVLPFKNDSPDQENEYFINGTMESILDNLCKIKDLRVISRTSVEQYRNTFKPIPEIAKEMQASFFLEASMRKYGNQIRMTVQLIDQTDTHLWSGQYERTIQQVEDLFSLEIEIAELVAEEVGAIITPEEKQRIEKAPTTSLTANDFYSKGKEEWNKYRFQNDKEAIYRAEQLFRKALEFDSTFALAYVGLGRIYFDEDTYTEKILSETFMDSVLFFVNKALSFDHQLAEAYRLRGMHTMEVSGQRNRALSDFNRALELNPNDQETYYERGYHYIDYLGNFVSGLEDIEEALKRSSGSERLARIGNLRGIYRGIGFYDISDHYSRQILSLTGDSVEYYYSLIWNAYCKEDVEAMLENERKIQVFAPDYRLWGFLAMDVGYEDVVIEESKPEIEAYLAGEPATGVAALYGYGAGYASWLLGEHEQAEYFFDLQIKYGEEIIAHNRAHAIFGHSHIDMVKVFAFTGKFEKAFEYLDDLAENLNTIPTWMTAMINLCPMIEPIQDTPEYKEIMQKMELKYQAEHNRVRRWLEETERMEQFGL